MDSTAVAQTWNLSLAQKIGTAGAKEVKENNAGIWLSPALNLHRSPLCGRNFEYYSEDPVLMGKIAAESTKGLADFGVYVYLKHCFLNDQETYRCGGWTWANEQTIREIYLKSFQIAIEAPNDFSDVVFSGTLELHHGKSSIPVWGFIPVDDYFALLEKYYGGIPTGEYGWDENWNRIEITTPDSLYDLGDTQFGNIIATITSAEVIDGLPAPVIPEPDEGYGVLGTGIYKAER